MGTQQGQGIASSMHAPGLAEPSHSGTPLQGHPPTQIPSQNEVLHGLIQSLVRDAVAQGTAALNEEIGKLRTELKDM